MSALADGSATDKKRAGGIYPWLFLFAATAFLVSVLLTSYLRGIHDSKSGVHQCVETCGSAGIKVYDGPRGICECRDPKEGE